MDDGRKIDNRSTGNGHSFPRTLHTLNVFDLNLSISEMILCVLIFLLPPATKLGQGNIFRSVCQEFCSKVGEGVCPIACWDTPGADTPPPRNSACCEIRATSGRYASYWNVYLLYVLKKSLSFI